MRACLDVVEQDSKCNVYSNSAASSRLCSFASNTKPTEICERFIEGDIYHHWLAVQLYDLKIDLMTNGCGNQSSTLDLLVERWDKARSAEELHIGLVYLAVLLNSFIFGDCPTLGMCVCSLRNQKPDFTVLPFQLILSILCQCTSVLLLSQST